LGSLTTGFYRSAADQIGVTVAGALLWEFSASLFGGKQLVGSPQMVGNAVGATVANFSFNGDTDTGMGRAGANALNLITGAVAALQIDASQQITTVTSFTSGGTNDFGFNATTTLNDAGAAGGSDVFRLYKGNITATDVTGWDSVYLMDLQLDTVSKFSVTSAGTVTAPSLVATTGITMVNAINEFSVDGTMAGNSTTAVPVESAIVTYVAAQIAATSDPAVNAVGATPVDTDVTAWANGTSGVVVGTGGRVWWAFKNATDVYYIEATAI
jgi:hypothetical protein